ncbi:stage III sporulation protein AF [Sediminibacillus massiliensis]|uniref:stage III sporulation protein AF n=1 Tax=Sediminibacillus massiliensis TaxID=1926277 RepID=UPI0015C32C70
MLIDLILPNSSMKKYIKVVVGLLLILIFLQPLFHLFRSDFETYLNNAIPALEAEMSDQQMKNSIESKKSEIEDSQRAYILEQMVVQMKQQVEEGLSKQYGVQINDIVFSFQEGSELTFETLETVDVVLEASPLRTNKGEVKEIVIDTEQDVQNLRNQETDQIQKYLYESWQLENQNLKVHWEGE